MGIYYLAALAAGYDSRMEFPMNNLTLLRVFRILIK